jgi:hypothetical protein
LDAVTAGAAAVDSLAGRQQQLVVVRSWFLMMSWMHCLVLKVGSWERGGWVGRRESGWEAEWVDVCVVSGWVGGQGWVGGRNSAPCKQHKLGADGTAWRHDLLLGPRCSTVM